MIFWVWVVADTARNWEFENWSVDTYMGQKMDIHLSEGNVSTFYTETVV